MDRMICHLPGWCKDRHSPSALETLYQFLSNWDEYNGGKTE